MFFENEQKIAKMLKQNDNFSHFARHRLFKNRYVATPLLTKNWCFLNLLFFKKTLMLNKKKLKSRKSKDKERGSERKRREESQKKRKD